MPYVAVNSDSHKITLHYTVCMGENAWQELAVQSRDHRSLVGTNEEFTFEDDPLRDSLSNVEEGLAEDCRQYDKSRNAWRSHECLVKVLFIPGLAAKRNTEYFEHQIKCLTAMKDTHGRPLVCVCTIDNRGVGDSTVPESRTAYTTDIMCRDVIDLLDHLGWKQVHIIGQSLGALVSLKLAATVPQRLKSVTIMGAVLSGLHMWWTGWAMAPRQGFKFFFGGLRGKVEANLQMQFTDHYLGEVVDGKSRLETMSAKIIQGIKYNREASKGREEKEARRKRNVAGRRGQLHALLRHRLSRDEVRSIVGAEHFRVTIIHGWKDRLISPGQVCQLGSALRANMVATEAAHAGIGIEAASVVNEMLLKQVVGQQAPTVLQPGVVEASGCRASADDYSLAASYKQQQRQQQVLHLEASCTRGQDEPGLPQSRLVKRAQTSR